VTADPLKYFGTLFGHEGENSLLSKLTSEGLANGLSAGGLHQLNSFSGFRLDISLTRKGVQNYRRVVDCVFSYAQTLRELGPQRYIFDEMN
jgi:insulysin